MGYLAYFASDRGGEGYDIHEVVKPASVLAGRGLMIENGSKVQELSSPADDTAPFLFEDEFRPSVVVLAGSVPTLFFSSNRPGGKGGYDLYCMVFPSPFR